MNTDLKGKKAIVCGANKGIGRATAEELAVLGASVTLLARDEGKLAQLCNELSCAADQKHDYFVIDFAQTANLKMIIGDFARKNGPFHILVNNTGGPKPNSIENATLDELVSAFSQHLLGAHIMVQALLGGMKTEKYGRIINVLSTSVKQPIPGLGVSNTTRGAMASWAKTLSYEVASYGITVNNVLPGYTNTGRLEEIFLAKAQKSKQSIDEIKKEAILTIPAGRLGDPAEVAAVIAFLASPSASYINGANLPVDGGRTLSM